MSLIDDVSVFFSDFAVSVDTERYQSFPGIFDIGGYFADIAGSLGMSAQAPTLLCKLEDIQRLHVGIDDELTVNSDGYKVLDIHVEDGKLALLILEKTTGFP